MAVKKRGQTAVVASRPAPVGGLNARDAISDMPEKDAIVLDNWFPTPTNIQIRNGYVNWVTGITGWVESLCAYTAASSSKLFAAAGTAIYDVTSTGAVGAAVQSGLTNARWQHANFTTGGGSYLYMVNGADKPRLYDGAAWVAVDGASTPAITGVTTTNLIDVAVHKNRLWFIEKNTFKVWYLPLNSIGGAATNIDFGPLFKLGGYLQKMVSWSIDSSGSGSQDYAAFISSEGEIALYQGYDPSSTSTWALVGMFRVGRPQGRRCTAKVGSDVAMIGADGIISLSKALTTDRSQKQANISYKIVNSITSDIQDYPSNFGWQIILYPIGNKLIINVPTTENSTQYQYVMNTITSSWCTFGRYNSPWLAACFESLGDSLYYGGNGVVCKCDYGETDGGNAITADCQPAYSYFGYHGNLKMFTMARPIYMADGDITPSIALNIDFQLAQPAASRIYSGSNSLWDVSDWDTTSWVNAQAIKKNWLTVGGIGYAASLRTKLAVNNMTASLQSIDYVFENGGILG